MTKVIAFTGLAGSGKTTAAHYLVEHHGFVRTRFADPLKAMLRALGLGEAEIDGELKETPSALLGGRTPRHAMQTLGTEWGRFCIGEDFWIKHWQARAADCLDLGGRVVVDDCRFANEAAAIRTLGGIVVRVAGRGGIAGEHASEAMDFPSHVTVGNDGAIDAFFARVGSLVAN